MTERRQGGPLSVGALLGIAAGVVTMLAVYMMFLYAPTDRVQGAAQRIFYIHVPMAWLAYLAFFVVFVASILYLIKRTPRWDQLARSSAEVGLIFTTLVLLTGSIWGRPIWGTWWTWDARLTTTLLLWFIYLGYFMLRAYVSDRERGARYAAVLGIIGFIDVPIIHMSVRWWRTMHPEPIVLRAGGPAMPAEMFQTLMVSLLGFTLLYAFFTYQKFRIERMKDELAEYEFELSERQFGRAERVTA